MLFCGKCHQGCPRKNGRGERCLSKNMMLSKTKKKPTYNIAISRSEWANRWEIIVANSFNIKEICIVLNEDIYNRQEVYYKTSGEVIFNPPSALPQGSALRPLHLDFSTPIRQKFMKGTLKEVESCVQIGLERHKKKAIEKACQEIRKFMTYMHRRFISSFI